MASHRNQKIGWDWKIVKVSNGPFKNRLYARSPSGQLVRVTDADINGAVMQLVRDFGPAHTVNITDGNE